MKDLVQLKTLAIFVAPGTGLCLLSVGKWEDCVPVLTEDKNLQVQFVFTSHAVG